MALKRLNVPGINPGGVDKLYGEDWNRLVDALTGSVTEDIVLSGIFTAKGSRVEIRPNGVAPFNTPNTGLYITESSDNIARIYLQSNSASSRRKTLYVDNSNNFSIADSSDGGAIFSVNNGGSVGIPSGQKIFLDAAGFLGDTYLSESTANQIDFVLGGTNTLNLSSSAVTVKGADLGIASGAGKIRFTAGDSFLWEEQSGVLAIRNLANDAYRDIRLRTLSTISGAIKVASGDKLYLDGGGDTYFYEGSANVIKVYAGGGEIADMRDTRCAFKAGAVAGDPTSSDIGSGQYAVYKNTTSGAVKLWYNDGGAMKSTTLS